MGFLVAPDQRFRARNGLGTAVPQGAREPFVATMAPVHPPAQPPSTGDWIEVVSVPLPVDAATTWATTAASGAVVVFLGVVRDHADGRSGVTGLTYEAYEEEAVTKLAAVAAEARRQWPVIDRVALLHRIGDLELSDTAVAVVVSSPHRAEAFEAARYCIDTLKESVPIWKREHWEGGSDWGTGAQSVRAIG